jgi:polysaccharide lyase family 8-like protein
VELTRRRMLSLMSAAGLLTIVTPQRAGADTTDDRATLLANTVAIFAGTAASNARQEVAAKVAGITQTARTWLTRWDGAGTGELFQGVPLGTNDANLNASYQHLYEIALATRTPGSELHNDTALQQRVLDGLVWLHENYYGDQSAGYYGNWFNWEIGISTHVSKTLVLLAELAPADLVSTYVGSMDAYLRNGLNGDVNLDSRFHTGANLADITTNRIVQGALLADDARITKAVADQRTVFATIDPYNLQHGVTDGYYADGSFIQHHSVAYTGSYGRGLLTRVVQTIKILDGTGYARGDELVGVVNGWVRDGFAPLIFEGWMMEIVKGRAVSRTTTGYQDVTAIIEAVVDLSDYATGADAAALKGYVKFTRSASLNPNSFVSPVSIARYSDIVADSTIPAADLNAAERSVTFNAMDKTVHRRPGYAFALARSSDRISKYEYMSNENLMPWFQGDGTYYLYLSGQDQTQAFGVDYYTVVSPYALAGVTAPVEQRLTVPELYGQAWYENPAAGFTSSSESQNTYVYFPRGTNRHSGGAVLGAYGATGLVQSSDVAYAAKQAGDLPDDFVVYRNAEATKSWFLLDDEIVVLAAGLHDPARRALTTTVDSRHAATTDQVTIDGVRRDGRPWSGTGTADLRWLRYANATQGTAVGYAFLGDDPVTVGLEQVTRSRRVVRTANPDTPVTRNVFGVTYQHRAGARPLALAYALVPNATTAALATYRHGPVSVLANSTRLQAVKHDRLGLTLVNAFGNRWESTAGLSVDGPASVITRRTGHQVTVAASDPTMNRTRVTVLLHGRALRETAPADGVRVRRAPGGTLLEFDTHHTYGRSRTVNLR